MSGAVVLLAGGTGGSKLAAGLQDLLGSELTVIANTGDDIEIHGGHVSPDCDLCSYWLAGRIDERGWGIAGDSFAVMEALRRHGDDVWFSLGDEDLAVCLRRARRLGEGARLTETLAELGASLGLRARLLPMSDEPVRTWVRAQGRWWPFQEFMIRAGARGPIDDVAYRGIELARSTPELEAALSQARAVIIGPSNPVASIGPILAVAGLSERLRALPIPVIAVSPIVQGSVVKGPTEAFLQWAGLSCDAPSIAAYYGDLIDGLIADGPAGEIPVRRCELLMADADGRRALAGQALALCDELAASDR